MKNEKSCGAMIIEGNKVLVIQQKKSGFYSFPKGHVEGNETEAETAVREVKEETGIDIKVLEDKRYFMKFVQGGDINKEVVFFIARPLNTEGLSMQEKEIKDIKWVDINEVENILSFENIKNLWLEAKIDL